MSNNIEQQSVIDFFARTRAPARVPWSPLFPLQKKELYPEQRPRVLFFGMQGNFSVPSLQALLASDIEVCAIVVPITPIPGLKQPAIQRQEQLHGRRAALPLASLHPSIIEIAQKQQIPLWQVRRLSDATTYSTLAAYQPDSICIACFSQRIPRSIIELPRLGCLNVHPSLLPAKRGPVPLFWTFRYGDQATGVTIHFLDAQMDTGDMLAQEKIEVPDGIGYAQLESQCAIKGGSLLATVVHDLYKGNRKGIPQDEEKSSYFSFPTDEDFVIQAEECDARHIYTFINGVGDWDRPIEIHVDNEIIFTRQCISYSRRDTNSNLQINAKIDHIDASEEREIPCRNGWVRVRLLEEK